MKVLLINGSPRAKGCTYTALMTVAAQLEQEGVEWELIQSGTGPIQDCIGCKKCKGVGRCVFDNDPINEIIKKAEQADGFVFGTPVYIAHPTGRILSILDRVFYAGGRAFAFKPGAAVTSARRAGTTATLDVMSKHFSIAGMPIVSSSYWASVHGGTPEEVLQDAEGLQTMRNLGRNMAWLLKCIEAGQKSGIELPKTERNSRTNFIRP